MSMNSVLEGFRAGALTSSLPLQELQSDAWRQFALHESNTIGSAMVGDDMELDDTQLRDIVDRVRSIPHVHQLPLSAMRIQSRSDDDTWLTREEFAPLDDVCTKVCKRLFFPDAIARARLVVHILQLYDRAHDLGLPARLVLQGGVMMRLILREFLLDLPRDARDALRSYLHDYKTLTTSNIECELIPDPPIDDDRSTAPDSQQTVWAGYLLLLLLQGVLQDEMNGRKPPQLVHMDWDEDLEADQLAEALQNEVDRLPEDHALYGSRVDKVVFGSNVRDPPAGYETRLGRNVPPTRQNLCVFQGDDRDTRDVAVAHAKEVLETIGASFPNHESNGTLYCNLHMVAGHDDRVRDEELLTSSHTCCIKHAFVLYYTTYDGQRRCDRLAGTLLKLSCVDLADERHARIRAACTTQPVYVDYPILGAEEAVKLRSYSIEGFMNDQTVKIHNRAEAPWLVPDVATLQLQYLCLLIMHHSRSAALNDFQTALLHVRDALINDRRVASSVPELNAAINRELDTLSGSSTTTRGKAALAAYKTTLVFHVDTIVTALTKTPSQDNGHKLRGVDCRHLEKLSLL